MLQFAEKMINLLFIYIKKKFLYNLEVIYCNLNIIELVNGFNNCHNFMKYIYFAV